MQRSSSTVEEIRGASNTIVISLKLGTVQVSSNSSRFIHLEDGPKFINPWIGEAYSSESKKISLANEDGIDLEVGYGVDLVVLEFEGGKVPPKKKKGLKNCDLTPKF